MADRLGAPTNTGWLQRRALLAGSLKTLWHSYLFLVFSWFDSQSRPSKSPSPLMADVLKMAQSLFLMACKLRPSATAPSSSAPGRSCTYHKMC